MESSTRRDSECVTFGLGCFMWFLVSHCTSDLIFSQKQFIFAALQRMGFNVVYLLAVYF